MYLERKFHPVGQGLFCTERFSDAYGQEPFCNIIYDCGTLNPQGLVDKSIAAEFGPKKKSGKVDIDFVFISHLHADHISGLDTLLDYCNVKEYVVPVLSTDRIAEAYIFNVIHNVASANKVLARLANNNAQGVRQIGEGTQMEYSLPDTPYWLFKPYLPSDLTNNTLEKELKEGFTDLWNAFDMKDFAKVDSLFEKMEKDDRRKLKSAYKKAFGGDHNYMLTLYSGYYAPTVELQECNALYCGDYEAVDNDAVIKLTDPLVGRWPKVGTLQVPHHGSNNNNCQELYDAERHCVISYGVSNFKHPHIETIDFILNAQNGKALDTLHLVNAGAGFSQRLTI